MKLGNLYGRSLNKNSILSLSMYCTISYDTQLLPLMYQFLKVLTELKSELRLQIEVVHSIKIKIYLMMLLQWNPDS